MEGFFVDEGFDAEFDGFVGGGGLGEVEFGEDGGEEGGVVDEGGEELVVEGEDGGGLVVGRDLAEGGGDEGGGGGGGRVEGRGESGAGWGEVGWRLFWLEAFGGVRGRGDVLDGFVHFEGWVGLHCWGRLGWEIK